MACIGVGEEVPEGTQNGEVKRGGRWHYLRSLGKGSNTWRGSTHKRVLQQQQPRHVTVAPHALLVRELGKDQGLKRRM